MGVGKAEFVGHGFGKGLFVMCFKSFKGCDGVVLVFDQRHQGLAEAKQVPVGDAGLFVKSVAALGVGVVANVRGVVPIQKLEGAVIERQSQNTHVVGVHHAVAKPHRLPAGDHLGGAFCDSRYERGVGVAVPSGARLALRVKVFDHKICQGLEFGVLVRVAKMLEMTKANKARRNPRYHCRRFFLLSPHGGV